MIYNVHERLITAPVHKGLFLLQVGVAESAADEEHA